MKKMNPEHIHIQTHVYTQTCVHIHTYIHMYVHTSTHIHVCANTHTYIGLACGEWQQVLVVRPIAVCTALPQGKRRRAGQCASAGY